MIKKHFIKFVSLALALLMILQIVFCKVKIER